MTRVGGDVVVPGWTDETRLNATITRMRGSLNINFSGLPNATTIVAYYTVSTRAIAKFNSRTKPISPRSLVWRTVAAQDVIPIDANDALLIDIEMAQNFKSHATHATQATQDSQAAQARAAKNSGSAQ